MVGSPERVVGHALFASGGDGRAEVAFAIAAEYRGRGLATILLGQLADAAAANGIDTLVVLDARSSGAVRTASCAVFHCWRVTTVPRGVTSRRATLRHTTL
jgi:ribosomal protein S18 acetylase RimI-like enzyme